MLTVKISVLFLASFLIYFLISLPFYSGDVKNHIVWGESILNKGPLGFYEREFHDFSFPNYPPVSMLLFAVSVWLYETINFVSNFLNKTLGFFPSNLIHFLEWENVKIAFLKLPAIVPVILIGILLQKKKTWLSLLFLLNPAVIYIAAVWGQNDLLQNLFLLLAIFLLFKEKMLLSFIAAGLAILSKQTILMLWLMYLFLVFKKYGWQKSLYGLLVSLGLLFISYLPFHNFSLTWPFEFYKESLKTTGFLVSDNAINFWGLIFNFNKVDASSLFLGIPLEIWGYGLFIILAAPIMYKFWKSKLSEEKAFHLFFIISGLYFLVLTRMHERYLIPVIVFATILVVFKKRLYWINLIYFSTLHFINLYRGLLQPDIPILNILINQFLFLDLLVIGYIILLGVNVAHFIRKDNVSS